MAKGENIFKRKDRRWEARYIKGYEPSGKIKYGFCYGKTYREAKEKVMKYRALLCSGKPLPESGTKHRFSYYCDAWLAGRRTAIKESTYIKYETALEKYIKPKLGGCYPLGITTGMIDEFSHALLQEDGLSAKTVYDILVVLRGILKDAAAQFPGVFPAVEIHYPKRCRTEMRVLSREEQERFVRYLLDDMDTCKFGVLLALLTGMRLGELCALRWENVSAGERAVRITATMQRLRDTAHSGEERTRVVVGSPKSDTSRRVIPLTDYAAALCREMQAADPAAYILTGTTRYMEPRALQYRMEKYTKACGLEGVHCHTLRHTFATRAVEVGFELKSLSEVLGHASTTITLERYVHSSMALKRDNMRKLEAAGF